MQEMADLAQMRAMKFEVVNKATIDIVSRHMIKSEIKTMKMKNQSMNSRESF